MDDNQVRTLGLAGGGAALVVALALAFTGDDKAPAQTQPAVDPPTSTTTVTTTPSVSATTPIPSVETAMAEGPPPMAVVKPAPPKASEVPQNPNLEFLVRFDQRHPLHRAHQLVQAGRESEAEDLVHATLRQRSEFAGLCFSRFTLGGSEVVLAHCTRVARAQVARTSDRWLRKIRGMRGVQYADANVIADVEGR
jgi:hypothetical protein